MRFVFRRLCMPFLLATAIAVFACPAGAADPVADFYRGKTVRIVVGYDPGGGYDVYARALAHFLPNHIPGNPSVIVQNMPGAGSMTATNFLYAKAEKDGTVIGAPSNSAAFAPLQGVKAATFDPTKFNWVGSPNKETGILIVWHTAPVNTLEDVRRTEITIGSSSANATTSFFARVLNATLGTKLKIIHGYPGSTESFLAMERGEVDGYPSAFWSSLKANKPNWLKDKRIKMLVQYGPEPNPEIADVPFARDLAVGEENKLLLDVAVAPLAFGRPYMLPPEVPMERVAALRRAFLETYKDPGFMAESAKQHLEVDATTGEQMQDILARAYGAPAAVVKRLKALYEAANEK